MALFLLLTLNVGGFVLLVASFAAIFYNLRLDVRDRPARWRWLWDRRWNLGVLLGIISVFSFYPLLYEGKWSTVVGIPFVVCEIVEGDDPHGPGVISMALNFLFWLLLPQFVLWVTSGRRRVREAGSHDSAPPA